VETLDKFFINDQLARTSQIIKIIQAVQPQIYLLFKALE